MFFAPQDNNKYRIRFSRSVSQFSSAKEERGNGPPRPPSCGKIRARAHGYKLSPPKRWINFLPIPYQAEREKKALCNRILSAVLSIVRYSGREMHEEQFVFDDGR